MRDCPDYTSQHEKIHVNGGQEHFLSIEFWTGYSDFPSMVDWKLEAPRSQNQTFSSWVAFGRVFYYSNRKDTKRLVPVTHILPILK